MLRRASILIWCACASGCGQEMPPESRDSGVDFAASPDLATEPPSDLAMSPDLASASKPGFGAWTPLGATHGNSVVVADFNNDTKADIAVSNYQTLAVTVLLGNGNGTFQPQIDSFAGNFYDAGNFNVW